MLSQAEHIKVLRLKLLTMMENNFFEALTVFYQFLYRYHPQLSIVIFSIGIILFDSNGLATFQNLLLSQTFLLCKLLEFSFLLSYQVLHISLFVYCIYFYFPRSYF